MHADARSAIRAQLIASVERRIAALDGEARRALEARLAKLQGLDGDAPGAASDTTAAAPHPTPLRALLDHLGHATSPGPSAYPDVPALADFRQLWSTLRADSQLRQSITHAPADAGPLNSAALASRAIVLMRELSPAYLRSFLAYVDDLAWLEQLGGAGSVSTSVAGPPRKRARRKPQA